MAHIKVSHERHKKESVSALPLDDHIERRVDDLINYSMEKLNTEIANDRRTERKVE